MLQGTVLPGALTCRLQTPAHCPGQSCTPSQSHSLRVLQSHWSLLPRRQMGMTRNEPWERPQAQSSTGFPHPAHGPIPAWAHKPNSPTEGKSMTKALLLFLAVNIGLSQRAHSWETPCCKIPITLSCFCTNTDSSQQTLSPVRRNQSCLKLWKELEVNHKAVVQLRKKPAVLFQHRRNVTAYYQWFSNTLPLFSLFFF